MNRLFGIAIAVFVGWVSIRLMNVLSADAMAMAVGVLMGILAGIPTALLVLASANKRPQPVAEPPRVEIHNHHYGQPAPSITIDIVPAAVHLAAQQRSGFAQHDGERWIIVDAAGRRLATQRHRQIT